MGKRRVKFVTMATPSLCLLTVVRKPCENMQFIGISERRRSPCSKTHTVPSYKALNGFKNDFTFCLSHYGRHFKVKTPNLTSGATTLLAYLSSAYSEVKEAHSNSAGHLGFALIWG